MNAYICMCLPPSTLLILLLFLCLQYQSLRIAPPFPSHTLLLNSTYMAELVIYMCVFVLCDSIFFNVTWYVFVFSFLYVILSPSSFCLFPMYVCKYMNIYLNTGCLSILMFLAPLPEVTP